MGTLNVRAVFERGGRGLLDASGPPREELLFRVVETTSVRGRMAKVDAQEPDRASTSLRRWIRTHCDPSGPDTFTSQSSLTRDGVTKAALGGWRPVKDERSRMFMGVQRGSYETETDAPHSHETRDWNWLQAPDPPFLYMLTDHWPSKERSGAEPEPEIEGEWETGSFPLQWRPFPGEYVSMWGRHVYDLGHLPIHAEIHPAHTILRERATVGTLDGARVPVTRAVIGMGLSGGFPGSTVGRWDLEAGGQPDGVFGDTLDCWVTDLRKHPLVHTLYPPVRRPSSTARIVCDVRLSEVITCGDWRQVDRFLEVCQFDAPADGGEGLAFRVWSREAQLPRGFPPVASPAHALPTLTPIQRRGEEAHGVELRVDLSAYAHEIPVAYYAVVEVGWSEPGREAQRCYEVTFESVTAVETDELYDDWHLYYGVNGEWRAWWTDDLVEEGRTYAREDRFLVWTFDDLPLILCDCGVEWDGVDWGEADVCGGNTRMDRLNLVARGPEHLDSLARLGGVSVVSRSEREIRFRAMPAESYGVRHEWTIVVRRLA